MIHAIANLMRSLGQAFTAPTAPAITGISSASGSLTVTINAASETDVVYVRYRVVPGLGAWSAESETLKRSGDGTVQVTGLTDLLTYEVSCYTKTEIGISAWAPPVFGTPSASYSTEIRDSAAAALLEVCKSSPNGDQVTYSNPGDSDISVYAILDQAEQLTGLIGETDRMTARLTVPRQTSFPPVEFLPGHTVTVDGVKYMIDSVSHDGISLGRSAVFVFRIWRYREQMVEISD